MILSIIVPVYNGEKYIKRCITSIQSSLESVEGEAEIIIINDGSTDATSEICDKLCRNDERIKVLSLNDEGVSAARNAGLNVATGEFISFIDADDVVDADMFKKLIEASLSTGADITGCYFYQWNENSQTARSDTDLKIESYTSDSFIKKELLNGNTRCWSKIYRNSSIKDLRFISGLSIGEDMLFLAQAALKSGLIVEMKGYSGYGYYYNPTGAMNRPFTPKYMDQIYSWEKLKDIISDVNGLKDREAINNLDSKLAMSIMLVASKIAELSKQEISKYSGEIKSCKEKLIGLLKSNKEFFGRLSLGYKIKIMLFSKIPGLYISLYHFWKHS